MCNKQKGFTDKASKFVLHLTLDQLKEISYSVFAITLCAS